MNQMKSNPTRCVVYCRSDRDVRESATASARETLKRLFSAISFGWRRSQCFFYLTCQDRSKNCSGSCSCFCIHLCLSTTISENIWHKSSHWCSFYPNANFAPFIWFAPFSFVDSRDQSGRPKCEQDCSTQFLHSE